MFVFLGSIWLVIIGNGGKIICKHAIENSNKNNSLLVILKIISPVKVNQNKNGLYHSNTQI